MSFESDLKGFEDKLDKRINLFIDDVEDEILTSIVMGTPVDTGRLRANWQPTLRSPSTFSVNQFDQDGGSTIAKVESFISKLNGGRLIYFTNNIEYGPGIEYEGRSRFKAPLGMLRKNAIRFPAVVKMMVTKHKL